MRNVRTRRSACPISSALDLLGDKWSLLIIRDLMFTPKRRYREFLQSEEAISSNILAERLKSLVEAGVLWKADDPTHKQKAEYRLTEMGQELLPVLAALGAWGARHLPGTEDVPFALGRDGSPKLKGMRGELRALHAPD